MDGLGVPEDWFEKHSFRDPLRSRDLDHLLRERLWALTGLAGEAASLSRSSVRLHGQAPPEHKLTAAACKGVNVLILGPVNLPFPCSHAHHPFHTL